MSVLSRIRSWFAGAPAPIIVPFNPAGASPARPSVTESKLLELLGLFGPKRKAERRSRSYKLPDPAPGVVPKAASLLANDSQIAAVYKFGPECGWDGYGFMGYALLSDLAQIPEFRRPSEIIANEMTRKWIKVISTGDEDKTEKIKVIEAELKRIGAQAAFRKAFELDNFMGIGHLFIDLGDEAAAELPMVLEANVALNSLKGIRAIEPVWTYPNNYNSTDPLRSDFYRPQTWFVLSKEVHETRLLSFNSRPVPDMLKPAYMFGGVSLTQLMQPYVENWLRTRQSVSDITHNFSTPVLKTDLGKLTEPGGAAILATRAMVFNAGRDNQGLMVVDKESEDFVNVSAPLSGLDALQAQAQEQMAAICGIPLVKFFGVTPSGLNASSDGELRCFYDNIESAQERTGTPNMQTLLKVIQMSKFGAIDPDITFKWEPLWSLDEKGLAEVRKINAETDGAYVDRGVLDAAEVRKTIAGEEDSRYSSIDVDELPDQPEGEGDLDDGDDDEQDDGGNHPALAAPPARLQNPGEIRTTA